MEETMFYSYLVVLMRTLNSFSCSFSCRTLFCFVEKTNTEFHSTESNGSFLSSSSGGVNTDVTSQTYP